jgi:hypothetical protein
LQWKLKVIIVSVVVLYDKYNISLPRLFLLPFVFMADGNTKYYIDDVVPPVAQTGKPGSVSASKPPQSVSQTAASVNKRYASPQQQQQQQQQQQPYPNNNLNKGNNASSYSGNTYASKPSMQQNYANSSQSSRFQLQPQQQQLQSMYTVQSPHQQQMVYEQKPPVFGNVQVHSASTNSARPPVPAGPPPATSYSSSFQPQHNPTPPKKVAVSDLPDLPEYLAEKTKVAAIMRDFTDNKVQFRARDGHLIGMTEYQSIAKLIKSGEKHETFMRGKMQVYKTGYNKKTGVYTENHLFIPEFVEVEAGSAVHSSAVAASVDSTMAGGLQGQGQGSVAPVAAAVEPNNQFYASFAGSGTKPIGPFSATSAASSSSSSVLYQQQQNQHQPGFDLVAGLSQWLPSSKDKQLDQDFNKKYDDYFGESSSSSSASAAISGSGSGPPGIASLKQDGLYPGSSAFVPSFPAPRSTSASASASASSSVYAVVAPELTASQQANWQPRPEGNFPLAFAEPYYAPQSSSNSSNNSKAPPARTEGQLFWDELGGTF